MSLPNLRAADPACPACGGKGFTFSADGGAGAARVCACRLPGGTGPVATPGKRIDKTPKPVRDLEALAAALET